MAERLRGSLDHLRHDVAKKIHQTEPMKQYKQWERRFFAEHHENILAGTPRLRVPGHWERYQELIATGDYHPIVLGAHSSHPAGVPTMEEAFDMVQMANRVLPPEQQLQGSLMFFAYNIRDDRVEQNGQAAELVNYFKLIEPTFTKLHVTPLLVIRDKDKQFVTTEQLEANRLEQRRALSKIVERGQIPIVLPEGTVEGGRQKERGRPGEINGMVKLQDNSIEYPTTFIRRQGKEPLLLFISPSGAHRIYNPTKGIEKVTPTAKAKILAKNIDLLSPRISPMMQSVIAWPLPYSCIEATFSENGRIPRGVLEQLGGEILAAMLPEDEQGYYGGVKPHLQALLQNGNWHQK